MGRNIQKKEKALSTRLNPLPPFLIFILNGLAIIHRVKANQQMKFSGCYFAAVCQGDQRNYYIYELLSFLG